MMIEIINLYKNYKGESGKLNQCIDIITEAIESGHKILLFSSYKIPNIKNEIRL